MIAQDRLGWVPAEPGEKLVRRIDRGVARLCDKLFAAEPYLAGDAVWRRPVRHVERDASGVATDERAVAQVLQSDVEGHRFVACWSQCEASRKLEDLRDVVDDLPNLDNRVEICRRSGGCESALRSAPVHIDA